MKLLIIIVQDEDSERLIKKMNINGISCTKLASTGGFLKLGNTTLIVGIDEKQLDNVLDMIKETCKTRKSLMNISSSIDSINGVYIPQSVEIETGGASVFIINTENKLKY